MVIKYVVYQKLIYVFRVRISQEGKTATRTEKRTNPFSFRGKSWRMSNALALSLYISALCSHSLFSDRFSAAHARHSDVINIIRFVGKTRCKWCKSQKVFSRMHFSSRVCASVRDSYKQSLPRHHIYIEQLSTHLNYGKDVHDGHSLFTVCATYSSHQPAKTEFTTAISYISMRLK